MDENKLSTVPDSFWDDDAPDLSTPEWRAKMDAAEVRRGDPIIRRGRPVSPQPKVSTTIRLSADVMAHFKAGGRGWQSRVDAALKDWIARRNG